MNSRDINPSDFFQQTSPVERIKFLLRYAVLAPSTHNSQPWLFKIEKDSCQIFIDREKYKIKEADPIERDLYVSFGCLVENLAVAASYFKVFKDLRFHESGDLIAEFFFMDLTRSNGGVDENYASLLRSITARVNARGIFEKELLTKEFISQIISFGRENVSINAITDKEKIKQLAGLTERGLRTAYASNSFRKEMSGWVRNSLSLKKDGIPGYSLRMPFFISFIFPYILRWFNIGAKVGWLNRLSIASAPLVVVFTSKESNRRVWFETGRAAEQVMLSACALGLKTSIFVAAVEIGELYKEVQRVLDTNEVPQLLMCVGRLNFNQKPNSRYPVESKLMNK